MEKKLKRTGVLDIILAACTFALVIAFTVAALSGSLSKESESWQESLGYVFFVIIILPLVFITFAAMAGFSVFWLICGIKFIKAAKTGEYPQKLLIADAVTKCVALLPYALVTYMLFSLGVAFGVAACLVCAYFLFPLVFVFAVLRAVRGE